jgi:hypothetical protein
VKRLVLLLIGVAVGLFPSSAAAADPIHVNGGGEGSLVGTPFSHFGLGVIVYPDGSARGHFECLMSGQTAFPGFEPLMAVEGQIQSGVATAGTNNDTATLFGVGTLNLGPSGKMDATFMVNLTEGGPGEGILQLTVLTPPFPVPPETVSDGRISIH